MLRKQPTSALLRGLTAALLVSTAFPLAAQDHSLADLVQRVERDFDRHDLDPTVRLQYKDGGPKPGVRCATRPVGDFERQFISAAVAEHLRTAGTRHRAEEVTIPVRFHVLRKKDGSFNVTDAQITEQMEVLNDSYREHGFVFVLEGIKRRQKDKFAKKCLRARIEKKFKKRYAVDPTSTLNIYTCRPRGDTLGYAYLPSDYPESNTLHGVVVLYSTLPGGDAAPFDLGDTMVHEVGHYLGLLHTFEGRCSGEGDLISDTPAERRPASGCPLSRDTCPSPGADPVRNFMDYSDDDCVEEFTPEQAMRMKDQVATFKPGLLP